MKRIALAVALLVSLAALAWPGFDECKAANVRDDYETAFQECKPLAEQGDAVAQTILGLMYANGDGVPQDFAKAATWFRKAAWQGVDLAQYFLGLAYDKGLGVPQDYAEAAKWYEAAGEQGNITARVNLGFM